MDNLMTVYLSGYLTCDKDNLVVGRYEREVGIVEIDTRLLSKEEITQKLLTGEWHILVERTLQKNEYDEISLDVELIEEDL